jgi:hypothetical protein
MTIKFTTHNDKHISTGGTHLIGYVSTSYEKLVETFGPPMNGHYKTDAEWDIKFSDGMVATIYNWKNGKNYLGDDGYDLHEINSWHIGGLKPQVKVRIKFLLGKLPLGDGRWIDVK